MIPFNLKYFISFLVLLIIEIVIAKYATGFIRHTVGDYLCVILIYTFIRSVTKLAIVKTSILVLIIAYVVEFLQLTDLSKMYPSEYSRILKIIIGTSFSLGDLVAYTLGIVTVYLIEKKITKSRIAV